MRRVAAACLALCVAWWGAGPGAAAQSPRDAGSPSPRDAGAAVADAGLTAPGQTGDAGGLVGSNAGAGALVATDGGPAGIGAGAGSRAEVLPGELWPDLSSGVETPEEGAMVGDLVTVTITADAASGDDIAVPRQEFAPFEVHATDVQELEQDHGRRFVFTLELLAFEPGEHTIGPVRLRVVTADGTIGHVSTEPLTVTVGSLIGNEPNAELAPPTEPVRVMEEDYTLAWIAGAIGVILLLAVIMMLVARWWARREKPLPPPPPPRPAWEVAMERLEALRRTLADRMAAADVVGWADELSDTVREYLGRRYGFDGLESTTDEVISRLRKIQPVGISVEEVASMLGDCDLVKFAKATPEEQECEQLLASATNLVRRTRPGEPHAPSTRAQPSGGAA